MHKKFKNIMHWIDYAKQKAFCLNRKNLNSSIKFYALSQFIVQLNSINWQLTAKV